jgi:23S rRNA (guanosine2251-2'-O)-methyltransferase
MIIYGVNAVLDFVDLYSVRIEKLYVSNATLNKFSKTDKKKIKGVPIEEISDRKFEVLTKSTKHQSLAAKVKVDPPKNFNQLKSNLESLGKILILDHIQDPQNLGAIARTCVFFGINTIIIPSDRTASISPGSVKSSAGAIFSVNFYQVPNLGNVINEIKNAGYWILGTHLEGEDYKDTKFDKFMGENLAIVMGSEHKGLSTLIKKKCDILLRIKGSGDTNSLNVNVATAIMISRFVT